MERAFFEMLKNPVPTEFYFVLALMVFSIGLIGVMTKRNLIFMLMSVELMLNAVNVVFVAAAKNLNDVDGHIMTLFVITVAACEAAVGLAMVIAIFRKYGTVQVDFLRILRG